MLADVWKYGLLNRAAKVFASVTTFLLKFDFKYFNRVIVYSYIMILLSIIETQKSKKHADCIMNVATVVLFF